MVEGFFDEVDRTFLQGGDCHRNVAVTGDKDNRNVALTGDKVFLDFQTAHARHSDVKDENGDSVRIEFGEEHFTAFEKFNTVAGSFEKPLERITYGFVVFNDIHNTCGIRRFLSVGFRGHLNHHVPF